MKEVEKDQEKLRTDWKVISFIFEKIKKIIL